MAMRRIEKLRENYEYPAARRVAFEDMCTLVFCEYLKLPGAVNMRPNQKGVEADPVEAVDPETGDRKRFAYQAKYFDDATKLRDREGELKDSIDAARELEADVLMLFVNKDLLDTDREKAFEERLRAYAKKEAYAEDGAKLPAVRLDWWTLSRIEMILARPQYSHIPDRFLGSNVGAFYKAVRGQFYGEKGGVLYGEVPLSECYIEPTVKTWYGSDLSARSWIESFVDSDETVAVLCGEPGHGKTSLCRKAVSDFYEGGWLEHKVHNVFCFSLNPAGTSAIGHDGSLDLYSLFSWGLRRKSNLLDPEQCRNALVFLDGFDELLEWKPGLDLGVFIREYVARFQEETKSCVVITTRSMVLKPDARTLKVDRWGIPIVRLQLISKSQQVGWIEEYAGRLRRMLEGDTGTLLKNRANEDAEELVELEAYAEKYRKIDDGSDLQDVLGIPIIFRMVVTARYLPKEGESITRIYDDLFDATWARHDHKAAESPDPRKEVKDQLSRHALRVYTNDTETATVDDIPKSPWVFSFYTMCTEDAGDVKISRVGFLHRSFYQHFLAHEVLSWFERFAGALDDEAAFRDNLSYLACRRLDEGSLGYIKDMHGDLCGKDSLNVAFTKAYEVLEVTEGILPLPHDEENAQKFKVMTPLERANNVFWNVVSICSVCGHEAIAAEMSTLALRSYRLDGCHLESARLEGANLEWAVFGKANLEGANLIGANLAGANFREARLMGASLYGACFRGADFSGAYLIEARLKETDLRRTYLEMVNLMKSDLKNANLEYVNLEGADLEGANLEGADLKGARLLEANLERAQLGNADLEGANLKKASLGDADCVGAHLVEANLEGTILVGARLVSANLRGSHLAGANLWRADIEGAYLWQVNLDGARLGEVNLSEAYLLRARLRNTYLKQACLMRANLMNADLEGADLEGANLEGANLIGANLWRANLRRANLTGAYLERANLIQASLDGADLNGANLMGSQFARKHDLEKARIEGANLEGAIFGGECEEPQAPKPDAHD